MLTGKRLFEGETISDTLAQVLTKEPDWEQVPAKVRRLLAVLPAEGCQAAAASDRRLAASAHGRAAADYARAQKQAAVDRWRQCWPQR